MISKITYSSTYIFYESTCHKFNPIIVFFSMETMYDKHCSVRTIEVCRFYRSPSSIWIQKLAIGWVGSSIQMECGCNVFWREWKRTESVPEWRRITEASNMSITYLVSYKTCLN